MEDRFAVADASPTRDRIWGSVEAMEREDVKTLRIAAELLPKGQLWMYAHDAGIWCPIHVAFVHSPELVFACTASINEPPSWTPIT